MNQVFPKIGIFVVFCGFLWFCVVLCGFVWFCVVVCVEMGLGEEKHGEPCSPGLPTMGEWWTNGQGQWWKPGAHHDGWYGWGSSHSWGTDATNPHTDQGLPVVPAGNSAAGHGTSESDWEMDSELGVDKEKQEQLDELFKAERVMRARTSSYTAQEVSMIKHRLSAEKEWCCEF